MSAARVCRDAGCTSPLDGKGAKGWCSRCYKRDNYRLRVGGLTRRKILPGDRCGLENCDSQMRSKGLCHRHYQLARARRLGRTAVVKGPVTCHRLGCSSPHMAKGLCARHYNRAWRRKRRAASTLRPANHCRRCNHSIEAHMLLLLPESKHCIGCERIIQKRKRFEQAATGPYRGDLGSLSGVRPPGRLVGRPPRPQG